MKKVVISITIIFGVAIFSCNENHDEERSFTLANGITETGKIEQKTGLRAGRWVAKDSAGRVLYITNYGVDDSLIKKEFYKDGVKIKSIVYSNEDSIWNMKIYFDAFKEEECGLNLNDQIRYGQQVYFNNCQNCHRTSSNNGIATTGITSNQLDQLNQKYNSAKKKYSSNGVFNSAEKGIINSPHIKFLLLSECELSSLKMFISKKNNLRWSD